MKIFVNGTPTEIPLDLNIYMLLDQLDVQKKHIAIEINENIIFKTDWESTKLEEGDKIEIVKAIGGG
ncbi:MAG: sulfur carrier protein ThiS [Gammaproteobacteria bacterium]|jgi:sulfur carrier protein|nr:MAG: sulfur carrier protein ThiS [Gammaproteobacteria bacterium]|tara:strand:- start:552 stop:752 length:201 start_codon:yes stop_codon:yes gene_type:complete